MHGRTGGAEFSPDRDSQLPRSPSLHYFCPSCWRSISDPSQRCPACGTEPDRFSDQKSFAQKLLRAVSHPDAATARRAVWILGERRETGAIKVFQRVVRSADIYLLLAIAEAAGKIGGREAELLLKDLSMHPASVVRGVVNAELLRVHAERRE